MSRPKNMTLLTTQKNAVFASIKEAGLDPSLFKWATVKSHFSEKGVSKLIYSGTSFYFLFDFDLNQAFRVEFSPGPNLRFFCVRDPLSWNTVESDTVPRWVGWLKEEIETPDLWAEIDKYRALLSLTPPEDLVNEPIPAYEVEQIAQNLQLLAVQTAELEGLTKEQGDFVRSKLKYLADAAKRQGRLDWMHTSIGVLITIMMSLAAAPDATKAFCALVKKLFGQFIHFFPLQ